MGLDKAFRQSPRPSCRVPVARRDRDFSGGVHISRAEEESDSRPASICQMEPRAQCIGARWPFV